MDRLFDPEIWRGWAEAAWNWLAGAAADPDTLLQLGLCIAAIAAAWLAAHFARPVLAGRLETVRIPLQLHRFAHMLPGLLAPLLLVILLWLTIGLLNETAPGTGTRLLRILASLMSAWVAIRLGTTFIRNRLAARTLALAAWTLAALNITGLLDPAIEVLDSLAFTLGKLRLSVLTILKAALTLVLLMWGAALLSGFLDRRIRSVQELTPSIQVLIGKLLKFSLFTVAFIIALTSVGIDLSALAVLSGAIGLGLGFGLQKVVSNLVSGVIILLDKSIKPDDTIELGQTFGWVTSLGARYVSVVTRDGKEYLIPNEDFITQQVVNWSYSSELVRLEIPFGVSYDSDPHEVRRIACDAARKPERVAATPAPVCHLTGFGDSSLDFILRFWIKDPQGGTVNVTGEVLLALWDAFKEHGITIPFPHRQLLIDRPVRVKTIPEAPERAAREPPAPGSTGG
ncbi:MAG: mechanosensitive ion channel family protein [Alphaproteobacteria bacterium]